MVKEFIVGSLILGTAVAVGVIIGTVASEVVKVSATKTKHTVVKATNKSKKAESAKKTQQPKTRVQTIVVPAK